MNARHINFMHIKHFYSKLNSIHTIVREKERESEKDESNKKPGIYAFIIIIINLFSLNFFIDMHTCVHAEFYFNVFPS